MDGLCHVIQYPKRHLNSVKFVNDHACLTVVVQTDNLALGFWTKHSSLESDGSFPDIPLDQHHKSKKNRRNAPAYERFCFRVKNLRTLVPFLFCFWALSGGF